MSEVPYPPETEISINVQHLFENLITPFVQVERTLYHTDGRHENDAEHSFSLAIIAADLAATHRPDLDADKVAVYCLVHDLVEAYAGDTPTLNATDKMLQQKTDREAKALAAIKSNFEASNPWLVKKMEDYENLIDAEARFVKVIDKIMPKLFHLRDHGRVFKESNMTQEDLQDLQTRQVSK